MKITLLTIFLAIVMSGCATDSEMAKSGAAKEITVFNADRPPTQKYTVIRTLKDDGAEEEEDEITSKFVKQARKIGGDAILMHPKKASGMEMKPFGFGKMNYTYLYKADVLRLE